MATEKIRALIAEIEDEFYKKPLNYASMIKIKLLNILTILLRDFGHMTNHASQEYFHGKQGLNGLQEVINHINAHTADDLSLGTIACIAHMNPSYFSYYFKKYNGISPTQYIKRVRIEKAVELLAHSRMNVVDIAGMCGFNNMTNFYKAFRSITEKCPSDFR